MLKLKRGMKARSFSDSQHYIITAMHIIYENNRKIDLSQEDIGKTILNLFLEKKITHMHACGGNAKCSTCRVAILENAANLEAPTEKEQEIIKNKGFPGHIRLACQTKIKGTVRLRRLILDDEDMDLALTKSRGISGVLKKVAILFSDIRGFTHSTEKYLPYDIVHILNRYFARMGDAVIKNRGHIDKYIGDGLMALFGINDSSDKRICLSAVKSAMDMLKELKGLNKYLFENFNYQIKIGIGIHFGEVVLGNVGHPRIMHYTAIGDAVNVASRIESAD